MRFNLDDYITVQDRINSFWKDYPEGSITTELITHPTDWDAVIFKASVWRGQRMGTALAPDATGWASEREGLTERDGANFGSHHENCETSAIGRALANLGYATSQKDRPSREEMAKVNRVHEASAPRSSPSSGDFKFALPAEYAKPPATYGSNDEHVVRGRDVGGDRFGQNRAEPPAPVFGMRPPNDVTDRQWKFFRDTYMGAKIEFKNMEQQIRYAYRLPMSWTFNDVNKSQLSRVIDWLKTGPSGDFTSFLGPLAPPAPRDLGSEVEGFLRRIKASTTPGEVDQIWLDIVAGSYDQDPKLAMIWKEAFDEAVERQLSIPVGDVETER